MLYLTIPDPLQQFQNWLLPLLAQLTIHRLDRVAALVTEARYWHCEAGEAIRLEFAEVFVRLFVRIIFNGSENTHILSLSLGIRHRYEARCDLGVGVHSDVFFHVLNAEALISSAECRADCIRQALFTRVSGEQHEKYD